MYTISWTPATRIVVAVVIRGERKWHVSKTAGTASTSCQGSCEKVEVQPSSTIVRKASLQIVQTFSTLSCVV